jgi:hypothetical protein
MDDSTHRAFMKVVRDTATTPHTLLALRLTASQFAHEVQLALVTKKPATGEHVTIAPATTGTVVTATTGTVVTPPPLKKVKTEQTEDMVYMVPGVDH